MSDSELESIGSDNESQPQTCTANGRTPALTEYEKNFLLDLVNDQKSIIECKKMDGTSVSKKNKAWKLIESQFNADLNCTKRNVTQLRRGYENQKRKSKKEVSGHKRKINKTGGGKAGPPLSSTTEKLIGMIPDQMRSLENAYDCDAEEIVTISSPPKPPKERSRPKVTISASKLAHMNILPCSFSSENTSQEPSANPNTPADASDDIMVIPSEQSKKPAKLNKRTSAEDSGQKRTEKPDPRAKLLENEETEHQLRKRKLELEIEIFEKEHVEKMKMHHAEHSLRMNILELELAQKSEGIQLPDLK